MDSRNVKYVELPFVTIRIVKMLQKLMINNLQNKT